jgi:hypothetical protein
MDVVTDSLDAGGGSWADETLMAAVDNTAWFLDFLFGIGMVASNVLGYLPQLLETRRTGHTEGFSPFVCLILLVANSLRICFWAGKRFSMVLLFQVCVCVFMTTFVRV